MRSRARPPLTRLCGTASTVPIRRGWFDTIRPQCERVLLILCARWLSPEPTDHVRYRTYAFLWHEDSDRCRPTRGHSSTSPTSPASRTFACVSPVRPLRTPRPPRPIRTYRLAPPGWLIRLRRCAPLKLAGTVPCRPLLARTLSACHAMACHTSTCSNFYTG